MKHLSLLLKPASSLCNMRCGYCFYSGISSGRKFPSYGIMRLETAERIIGNIFKDISGGDEVVFAFQGGEPTLAGLPWFRHFVEYTSAKNNGAKISYAFQTNGLLLDESWCDFFRENNFLVGLSVDAGKRFHDRNRLSARVLPGEALQEKGFYSTYDTCMKAKNLLDKNSVEYNILCVLTSDLAKQFDKAWNFIRRENVRYIQFIPCLDPPGIREKTEIPDGSTLRPALFAKFYTGLLSYWIRELEKGNYHSVKFFDDTANYFLRGICSGCGLDGQCHNQYVVEADGSVYPCDFYALDRYKIGNLAESTPRELFDTEEVRVFLSEKPVLPEICASCKFFSACRGGCKRMRNVMYAAEGGAICGYRSFLEKCLDPLTRTVRRVFK